MDQSKTRIAERYAGRDPSRVGKRLASAPENVSLTVESSSLLVFLQPSSYGKLAKDLQDEAAATASEAVDGMKKELSRRLVLASTAQHGYISFAIHITHCI